MTNRTTVDEAEVPRWYRYLFGTLCAVFLGPILIGLVAFMGFLLAPIAVVGLPFLLAVFVELPRPEPTARTVYTAHPSRTPALAT